MATGEEMYLPDECWECIFKIYLGHGGDHRYLQPLSVLSKQFLTVTLFSTLSHSL